MGQTGSRVVGKLVNSFSYGSGAYDDERDVSQDNRLANLCSIYDLEPSQLAKLKFKDGQHLIYSRRGSMYFDEDGELAHEFYEETWKKGKKRMRKVNNKRLQPQGEVRYKHPRLHVDFPIILYEG